MKRLLLVLCVAISGGLYGQNQRDLKTLMNTIDVEIAFLKEIKKTDGNLFKSNFDFFTGEWYINQNDAMSYFINKEKDLERAVYASILLTSLAKAEGAYYTVMYMSRVWGLGTREEDPDVRSSYYEIVVGTTMKLQAHAERSLKVIRESEHVYSGTHAVNIVNLKRELRSVISKCNELLGA